MCAVLVPGKGAPSAVWVDSYRSHACCGFVSPTLIKISRGSRDLVGQAFLFHSRFLFSFFAPPISPLKFLFTCVTKKEQKKEGLRRSLSRYLVSILIILQ